jgi:hypothetical protein
MARHKVRRYVIMGSIAKAMISGPGIVIPQLLFLAVAGWLAEYIASAVGKGQLSQLIRLSCLLVGFCLVVNQVVIALGAFGKAIGM